MSIIKQFNLPDLRINISKTFDFNEDEKDIICFFENIKCLFFNYTSQNSSNEENDINIEYIILSSYLQSNVVLLSEVPNVFFDKIIEKETHIQNLQPILKLLFSWLEKKNDTLTDLSLETLVSYPFAFKKDISPDDRRKQNRSLVIKDLQNSYIQIPIGRNSFDEVDKYLNEGRSAILGSNNWQWA